MQKTCAELLRGVGACREAVDWSEQFGTDRQSAWVGCKRGDHMLWLLGRLSGPPDSDSRKAVVVCACECARLALPQYEVRHPDDRRPRNAIETAERHCEGKTTLKEVRDAAVDAVDADAAYDAAYAAAAAAAYAAAYAAAAYAYAAYAAYAADDAAAARSERLAECADIVRKHFPITPSISAES
jgi:hypothetical protein